MKIYRQSLLIPAVMLLLSMAFVGNAFAAEKVPDNTISAYVNDALRDDARVNASEITVMTKNGVVTLSGKVKSMAAKKYADMETKKINGVLSVINEINVSSLWRSDADIRNAVQRRILNSAVIKSEGIHVAGSDGTVILSGTVSSWSERQEAALLASEVYGVKKVVDNMTTEWTTTRTDQDIKGDAVAAIARDVYLENLPITVNVKQGIVILSGKAGSAYQKDRASDAVRWLFNVKGLKNKLKVVYREDFGTRKDQASPSDSALKADVRNELQADSRVNASDIQVKVSHGSVTLTGTVYSHKERQIASQDTQDVIGVAWVSNKLFARVDNRENWAVRDDVEFNLLTDATTKDFGIGVKAADGVVTLSGAVNNWYEKAHAEDVASRIKGVREIVNRIEVNSYRAAKASGDQSAAQVATEIKQGLKTNWSTWSVSDAINVSVADGVATLSGDVDTWRQRSEAADVAFTTKGVWEVRNKLVVDGYDYQWNNYTYYNYPTTYPLWGSWLDKK